MSDAPSREKRGRGGTINRRKKIASGTQTLQKKGKKKRIRKNSPTPARGKSERGGQSLLLQPEEKEKTGLRWAKLRKRGEFGAHYAERGKGRRGGGRVFLIIAFAGGGHRPAPAECQEEGS